MRWITPILLAACALPAQAEVTRFEVLSRVSPAFEGRSFGAGMTVEKITARATIALDPADPHNAVIADLVLAPRNAQGKVEAVTDVVILRPAATNGALLFEIANRGNKLIPGRMNDTDAAGSNRQETAADGGNGFLFRTGYTLVWAGWQGDAPNRDLRIETPVVPGVTGLSREEFQLPAGAGPKRVRLSYPAASTDSAKLTVRARTDDARRDVTGFQFPDPSTIEITAPADAPANAIYELLYTATEPRVTGMGLAAIRDVTAFLRRNKTAMNPLAANGRTGIDRAIGVGVSQSGRVLRDFLYYGMNEDEQGRMVFEGALPIIPGARRSFTNARFGQPGRNPGPEFDRGFPVGQFPFTYEVMEDAVSGRRDGILLRCRISNSCPRIMQVDSEFEFWGSQASLLVTDTRGYPIELPPDVRAYMMTGAPHSSAFDAVALRNPACALPVSPVNGNPVQRALLIALDEWITGGNEPPASRYPQRGQGTLAPAAAAYPAIPGLGYRGQYVRAQWIEQGEAGPELRGVYPQFVPVAGLDGNALGGVRLPIIAAPRATYTGWNPQAGRTGAQELCTQLGGVLPLAATEADRKAAGDPRPSLQELYPTPDAYLNAVRAAAEELIAARLMLPEDGEAAMLAAQQGTLARLGPLVP